MNPFLDKKPATEAIKGILALVFAILIFADPSVALKTITSYIGIIAIIAGLVLIVVSATGSGGLQSFGLFQGIVFVVIGALFVGYPAQVAGFFVVLFGLVITIAGAVQLIGYIKYKEMGPAPNLILLHAVLSLILGVLLLFNPFEGALLVTLIIGGYALWYGVVRLYMAWRIR